MLVRGGGERITSLLVRDLNCLAISIFSNLLAPNFAFLRSDNSNSIYQDRIPPSTTQHSLRGRLKLSRPRKKPTILLGLRCCLHSPNAKTSLLAMDLSKSRRPSIKQGFFVVPGAQPPTDKVRKQEAETFYTRRGAKAPASLFPLPPRTVCNRNGMLLLLLTTKSSWPNQCGSRTKPLGDCAPTSTSIVCRDGNRRGATV